MTAEILVLLCRLTAAIRAQKWRSAYLLAEAIEALQSAEVVP